MGNIKPKELNSIGYTDNIAKSIAIETIHKHCKHSSKEEIISVLQNIIRYPDKYKTHQIWGKLAEIVSPFKVEQLSYELREENIPYRIFGEENIDELARQQMTTAMKLPVTVAGALMPDGCAGYGLPIGGVLATTDDIVIPYAVGKDIACRMCLTILDVEADFIYKNHDKIVKVLIENTSFGSDNKPTGCHPHPVFDKSEFQEIPILKKNREKAIRQLGSSGMGNHFVDICEVELDSGNKVGLPQGRYAAILSHSGSRGLGSEIADFYTAIAKETCQLPRQAGPFAWLSLKNESGQEYWRCMEIAGEYSAANHDLIHHRITKALHLKSLLTISNHHNFAWKETLTDGTNVIIHRKGATPAHLGELGIIPGSMTSPGYLVSGKGNADSLFSASHGAGRMMSRFDARNSISRHAMKKLLADRGVTLIGGTTEEAPQAYKDIDMVISAQNELINIEGRILPKIVIMSE